MQYRLANRPVLCGSQTVSLDPIEYSFDPPVLIRVVFITRFILGAAAYDKGMFLFGSDSNRSCDRVKRRMCET